MTPRRTIGRGGRYGLGAHRGLRHRDGRPRAAGAERISGRRKPPPESPVERAAEALGRRFQSGDLGRLRRDQRNELFPRWPGRRISFHRILESKPDTDVQQNLQARLRKKTCPTWAGTKYKRLSWIEPASCPIESGTSVTSPLAQAARTLANASTRRCRNAHSLIPAIRLRLPVNTGKYEPGNDN